MVAEGKNSFPKQKWLFLIYQLNSRLHLESIYGCVLISDTGSVPKNILTSYWCGYLLGGIKEVKDFLQFYYWMLKMFPGVNNTRAICISFFFFFFFPFWKQKRAAVATSEWKNTGLELCNEKTSSSEGGRGTTKHLSLIYRLSSVGSLWTHLWSSVPLNTEEKYRMWFSCLLVRCFSKSAFGLANEGPS